VLYLSMYSRWLALTYFRFALLMCRITGVQPSLLLHPLDFLGSDDTRDLDFFPAMRVPHAKKVEVVSEVLRLMAKDYQIVPMHTHAEAVAGRSKALPRIEPKFEAGQ
ncbi:MAG: polysaccharide deacetylase, partial [Anaerolineae bacterium]|nr:polysaccharide deacetylase [Anaerolineae bacterium]